MDGKILDGWIGIWQRGAIRFSINFVCIFNFFNFFNYNNFEIFANNFFSLPPPSLLAFHFGWVSEMKWVKKKMRGVDPFFGTTNARPVREIVDYSRQVESQTNMFQSVLEGILDPIQKGGIQFNREEINIAISIQEVFLSTVWVCRSMLPSIFAVAPWKRINLGMIFLNWNIGFLICLYFNYFFGWHLVI